MLLDLNFFEGFEWPGSFPFVGLLFAFVLFLFRWRAKRNTIKKSPAQAKNVKRRGKYYGDDNTKEMDFSNVQPYKLDFEIKNEDPIPWWKDDYISDRVYSATMAIRNLAFDDWVVMDKNFAARMKLKQQVIEKVGPDALDCREGGLEGCIELLEILTQYLPRRFPTIFKLSEDGTCIRNEVTKETLRVAAPFEKHPLYIAGRLVEDDLNILTPGPDGEYVLSAVLSAFPAGFHVREKMGKPMTEIHKTVPTYKEKLQKAMNKYFDGVGPSKLVMRLNWSINDHEELFLVEGAHLYENDIPAVDTSIDINQVQLRVERQVLRRLPKSGAMCMLTKTYLYRLVEIAEYPGLAARLGGLLHKLPTKFAFYKRKPVWGEVVLEHLDEMAKRHPVEVKSDDEMGHTLDDRKSPTEAR